MTTDTHSRSSQARPEERRTTVRNGAVELAVFESGNPEGETILLVHGWPDTHHLWAKVVPELAGEFRLVSFDLRGFGESSPVSEVEQFELGRLAGDIRAVADAVSPDRPVHLLAHDWGSVASWEAVCRPGAEERFASFTSISGPSLDHAGAWLRRVATRPTPRGVGAVAAQALCSSYVAFFVSPLAPVFFRTVATPRRWARFLRVIEGTRDVDGTVAPTLVDDMVSGLRVYRANVGARLRGPRERRTSVPVLVLRPTRDVAIRRASYGDPGRWADHLERREVPHGHWMAISHPEVVAAETARLVRSCAR